MINSTELFYYLLESYADPEANSATQQPRQ